MMARRRVNKQEENEEKEGNENVTEILMTKDKQALFIRPKRLKAKKNKVKRAKQNYKFPSSGSWAQRM